MSVRVRFAPSPTGALHIGGVRTALYNYLFARANNGVFILRIEDTDQARYVEGAEKYIIESLEWLGIIPDEGPGFGGEYGPYRQSERQSIYSKYIGDLIADGSAYYAFDTPEELEQMRERLTAEGVYAPKYDQAVRKQMRNSLTLPAGEVQSLISSGTPYTVRLKVPEDTTVSFTDHIRGEVTFATDELDDKVLIKADGMPTYHFANVVDDHLMKITHVIRGEEWLSSTGHHVLLYKAFGWESTMPEFAHLPLILKPTGKGKLSKRDGAKFGFPVFPLTWKDEAGEFPGFREEGFLPGAVVNFLAFLGWNPGTEQEMFSLDELCKAFTLDRISKGGSRFDIDKARWYNSQYIQGSQSDLTANVGNILAGAGIDVEKEWLRNLVEIYNERVESLNDFVQIARLYKSAPGDFDDKTVRKKWSDEMSGRFRELKELLDNAAPATSGEFENIVKPFITENNMKFGDTLQLIRTAVSGSPQGPDVFKMLELLGGEEVARRIGRAIVEFDSIKKSENVG